MKITKSDERLLFLLDQNARSTLTELAKELNLSREAINYRIKRLESLGVISKHITKLNLSKLGLVNYIVYLKLNNLSKQQYDIFIKELSNQRSITWLASLGGTFDLALEIISESINDFDESLSEILRSHQNNINSYVVSTRVYEYVFGKKYLWPNSTENVLPIKKKHEELLDIDELDKKIISSLAQNARASVVEISNAIKEAPTTISFRLRQLEKDNIILGYTALSKIQYLGYSRFKALITVKNFSKKEDELIAYCKVHENIYYLNKTLGSWNFEIEIDVETPQQYQQFLINFRGRFGEYIQDIESLSVFEEHKHSYWPY